MLNSQALYDSEYASYAFQTSQFSWAVYNFSNRHFTSTIESANLSFMIGVGCDTTQQGCSLFGKFSPNARIFSTGNDFLNHIFSSGDQSVLNSLTPICVWSGIKNYRSIEYEPRNSMFFWVFWNTKQPTGIDPSWITFLRTLLFRKLTRV